MLNRIKKIVLEYAVGCVLGAIAAVVSSFYVSPLYAIGIGSVVGGIVNIILGEITR